MPISDSPDTLMGNFAAFDRNQAMIDMKLYNALRALGYGPATAYKKASAPRGR